MTLLSDLGIDPDEQAGRQMATDLLGTLSEGLVLAAHYVHA